MTNDSTAILLDTNVLVYTIDPRDTAKQTQAIAVVDRLVQDERAVISVQCLTEFFNAVTRRLPDALTATEASTRTGQFARTCRVVDLTAPIVLEAYRGVTLYRLSLWDSLIWASAKLSQLPIILTEDAEHGRFLEGVRFLNPFDPHFDLDALDY